MNSKSEIKKVSKSIKELESLTVTSYKLWMDKSLSGSERVRFLQVSQAAAEAEDILSKIKILLVN